jgi:hypothetical protein
MLLPVATSIINIVTQKTQQPFKIIVKSWLLYISYIHFKNACDSITRKASYNNLNEFEICLHMQPTS